MKPYYEDGLVQIFLGDCREVLLEIGAVDATLTDPPFGVRGEKWDSMNGWEFSQFCMSWMWHLPNVCPEALVFGTSDGATHALLSMLYERVRRLVWYKPEGSQYAGSQEARRWFSHEMIFHCYARDRWQVVEPRSLNMGLELRRARKEAGLSRGAVDFAIRGKKTGLCYRWEEGACIPTDEQVARLREVLRLSEDFERLRGVALEAKSVTLKKAAEKAAERAPEKADVLQYRTVTSGQHPTEKPVGLIADLMSTMEARLFLDPFMGSGTTLRAAKDLGRRAIGIEIEERYCEIAAKRCAQESLFALSDPDNDAEQQILAEVMP